MKIHDESKALKCDVCLKLFSNKSSLEEHYRIHTGEKPFACQICERKFTHRQSLVKHQVTHRDDRPFKCTICPEGRCFKTKDGLRNHMLIHYEPKFSCSFCDFKCHVKGYLRYHEKTHIKNLNFSLK